MTIKLFIKYYLKKKKDAREKQLITNHGMTN